MDKKGKKNRRLFTAGWALGFVAVQAVFRSAAGNGQ
jgi:hypothetical protein